MQGGTESLGTRLRREREQSQVSLRDIAAATKIQRKFLEAIEADEFGTLPPAPFAVGFLRAYARSIGLDPEEVVRLYDSLHGGGRWRQAQRRGEVEQGERARGRRRLGTALVGVVALLVLGALWYLPPRGDQAGSPPPPSGAAVSQPTEAGQRLPTISRETSQAAASPPVAAKPPALAPGQVTPPQSDQTQAATPRAVSGPSAGSPATASLPEPAAARPVGAVQTDGVVSQPATSTPGVVERPTEPASPPPRPLVVEVEAIEDTWLAVEVDSVKLPPFTLQSGQSTRWQATDRVEFLTIGNALGTRLRVNGRDVSLPSTRSNIVRNVILTRDLVN